MSLQTDLIEKWKPVLDATGHIYTKTGDGELAYWAEEASKAKFAVEAGTLFGRSAKVMLLSNPKLRLICIDPFFQDGTFEVSCHFLRDEVKEGRCDIFRMNSAEAIGYSRTMKGDLAAYELNTLPVDLVVVDNGHDEPDVLRDIDALYPLVRQGGLICGHDLDRDPDNGVTTAVKKRFPDFTEPVPRVWAWRKPL